jgi:hypothetical protein
MPPNLTQTPSLSKNSADLKLQPPYPTNLKKEKDFFLLDLKRPHIACAISVTSAERDATLMDAESVRFFNRLDCAALSV